MDDMLIGAIAAASLIIAMFFLRFWVNTHDRFFLFFGLSFGLESINRVMQVVIVDWRESSPACYLIRLVAYGLILAAVLDKNRRPSKEERI
ncbi:MAG TPA: DUF5985 family protein [Methylophilaceae bacterium]|nr:DUF5985 family protein [Methylophilaceae bacterium]